MMSKHLPKILEDIIEKLHMLGGGEDKEQDTDQPEGDEGSELGEDGKPGLHVEMVEMKKPHDGEDEDGDEKKKLFE